MMERHMTYELQARRAEKLWNFSERYPALYKLRVILWTFAGYALLVLLALTALTLSLGTLYFVFSTQLWGLMIVGWIPIAISWHLLRALFVRLDPPVGYPVGMRQAPGLFREIRTIRKHLGVPNIEGVLIVGDPNAAVVETPMMGGFMGWRRHLLIGLPLLLTLSPSQLKAVLAHEFAHLSARHGRFASWAFGVRLGWERLYASLSYRHDFVARVVLRIFTWYFDRLLPLTQVLARRHELAADQLAAEMTSPRIAAESLVMTELIESLLAERLWKRVWRRVETDVTPSASPYQELWNNRDTLLAPPWTSELVRAMSRTTAWNDSHPSLLDRVEALGHPRPLPQLEKELAGSLLNPEILEEIVTTYDQLWRREVLDSWQYRHNDVRKQLETLESRSAEEESPETRTDRAVLLADLGRDEEAFAILERNINELPEHAKGNFAFGRLLLERGESRGLSYLEKAMKSDWSSVFSACEVAFINLREMGRHEEADHWIRRAEKHSEALEKASQAASILLDSDQLAPSELDSEIRRHILEACDEMGWVGRLWLVRKRIPSLPDEWIEIVAVKPRLFGGMGKNGLQELANAIGETDPPIRVFAVGDSSLTRVLKQVAGEGTIDDLPRFRVRSET